MVGDGLSNCSYAVADKFIMPLPWAPQALYHRHMSICPNLLALGRNPLVRKLRRRQARLVCQNRSLAEVEFFVNDLDALEQQDENDQFGHSGTVANKRSGEQCPPLWNWLSDLQGFRVLQDHTVEEINFVATVRNEPLELPLENSSTVSDLI